MRKTFIVVLAAALVGGSGPVNDHGVMGQTFPVIEPDLLAVMEAKLRQMEASGKIDAINQEMKRKAIARVRRPQPVGGLSPAASSRTWLFDPSITVEDDILDNDGNIIAYRGQRVNPLEIMPMRKSLAFVDGDRIEELKWAVSRGDDSKVKIIFVNGSPFDEMKGYQRRFYFDQGGFLVEKFGIQRTPALVEPEGQMMKVTEVALVKGGAK